MSKTTGVVFSGKRYWSPLGSGAPPAGWPDTSRFKNHGTDSGGVSWVQLPSGVWVKQFDGVDGHSDQGSAPSIQPEQANVVSLCGWIYCDVFSAGNWDFMLGADNAGCLGFGVRTRFVQATNLGTADAPASSLTPTDGAWNFIGMTWDGVLVTYFLNSSVPESYAWNPTFNTTRNKWIGNAWFQFTAKKVGSLVMDKRILTPDEIARRFEAERRMFGL